jgi:flavin-binding protein dodecin
MAKSDATVARVTEIISSSPKSFDDAIERGISRANKTLKNVRAAWVKDMSIKLDGKKIVAYRVNLHVTFVLDD